MSTTARQLHLNAFLMSTGHHEAAWRLPESDPPRASATSALPASWRRIAERGKLDSRLLRRRPVACGRNVRPNGRPQTWSRSRCWRRWPALTERIGLIATASTTYNEPYNLARQFASLDRSAAAGRAGTSSPPRRRRGRRNFGLDELPDARRAVRPRRTSSSRSSPGCGTAGRTTRSSPTRRQRRLRRPGEGAPARPPRRALPGRAARSTSPRSPQGRPVAGAGRLVRDRQGASRPAYAEAVFTAQRTLEEGQAFYRDLKGRAGDGRPRPRPRQGAARHRADHRRHRGRGPRLERQLDELIVPEHGLAPAVEDIGIPLTSSTSTRPLPDDIARRAASRATTSRYAAQSSRTRGRDNLTVRQLLRGSAAAAATASSPARRSRSPTRIEEWFTNGAADGFNVMPPVLPARAGGVRRPASCRSCSSAACSAPSTTAARCATTTACRARPASTPRGLSTTRGSMTAACLTPALVVPTAPVAGRRLLLLAFVASTSPLAVDLYLASFPADPGRASATTPAMVQLTLTADPLSASRWGNWGAGPAVRPVRTAGPPPVASNAVTLASSVAIVARADHRARWIAGRFLQALSAAAGMVIARAMISDLADGYAGVRALSVMMSIHALVPRRRAPAGRRAGDDPAVARRARRVRRDRGRPARSQRRARAGRPCRQSGRASSAALRLTSHAGVLRRPGFLAHAVHARLRRGRSSMAFVVRLVLRLPGCAGASRRWPSV